MSSYSDLARDRPEDEFPGLALFEMLDAAGLLDEFRAAMRPPRDPARLADLLTRAGAHSPEASARSILLEPERYGF